MKSLKKLLCISYLEHKINDYVRSKVDDHDHARTLGAGNRQPNMDSTSVSSALKSPRRLACRGTEDDDYDIVLTKH